MLHADDLLLRPLVPDDAPVLAPLINNKKVWDNLRDFIPHPYTEEDARAFIASAQHPSPPLTFGIQTEGRLCGVIGLVPGQDIHRCTAEIGYWLGEDFWGRGIATKAVKCITDHGFERGFARIHAGVLAYNLASMRVLEKAGYVRDGIFRRALIKNGQIWDEYRYGIVR